MKYGLIYLKITFPKGHKLEWLKYCNIFGSLPDDMKSDLKKINDRINTMFSGNIIIPMNLSLHPGCVTTEIAASRVAREIFNKYSTLMKKYTPDECVRCVFAVGKVLNIEKYDNMHYLPPNDILIKLGAKIDSSDAPGLFYIKDEKVEKSKPMEKPKILKNKGNKF